MALWQWQNGNSYLLAGVVSWGMAVPPRVIRGVYQGGQLHQWIQDNTAGACCSGEDTSTGTTVQISNATSAKASFTAPQVTVSTKLGFELTVTDNAQGASSDRVDITVIPHQLGFGRLAAEARLKARPELAQPGRKPGRRAHGDGDGLSGQQIASSNF